MYSHGWLGKSPLVKPNCSTRKWSQEPFAYKIKLFSFFPNQLLLFCFILFNETPGRISFFSSSSTCLFSLISPFPCPPSTSGRMEKSHLLFRLFIFSFPKQSPPTLPVFCQYGVGQLKRNGQGIWREAEDWNSHQVVPWLKESGPAEPQSGTDSSGRERGDPSFSQDYASRLMPKLRRWACLL